MMVRMFFSEWYSSERKLILGWRAKKCDLTNLKNRVAQSDWQDWGGQGDQIHWV